MKTSTAFAILAFLAAGSNAIPISRRDGPECPCELLDPNNASDNVNSVHNDGNRFLPAHFATPNGDGSGKLVDPSQITIKPQQNDKPADPIANADDNNITLKLPHGGAVDDTTDSLVDGAESTTADPNQDEDDDSFSNSGSAFRATRPRPTSDSGTPDDISSTPDDSEDTLKEDVIEGVEMLDSNQQTGGILSEAKAESEGGEGESAPMEGGIQTLGLDKPVDGVAPGDKTGDKVKNITDPLKSSDTPEDVNDSDNNENGSDAIKETGDAVDDAVAQHVGADHQHHVDQATSQPVGQTVNDISPGTGSKVDDAANGPTSNVVEGVIPGSGPAVSDATKGPVSTTADGLVPGSSSKVDKAVDGPTTDAGDDFFPGSGATLSNAASRPPKDTGKDALSGDNEILKPVTGSDPLSTLSNPPSSMDNPFASIPSIDVNASVKPSQQQTEKLPIAGEALRPVTGALTSGSPLTQGKTDQLTDAVRPAGSSLLGTLIGNGRPVQNSGSVVNQVVSPLSGTTKPVTSSPGLANIVSGGNGIPIVNNLAQPQGNPIKPGTVQNLPIVNNVAQPKGTPVNTGTVQGLPIVNTLAQPQGNPIDSDKVHSLPLVNSVHQPGENPVKTGTVSGLPLISTLAQPDAVEDEGDFFQDAGSKFASRPGSIKGSDIQPAVEDISDDIEEGSDPVNDGPDGVIDEASDDLAEENVKACKGCIENAIEPADSRLTDAEAVAASDPLRVEPIAKDPQSEAPISYECATSPVTSMPEYTMPCITNWGGRLGDEVDMCISQSQLNQRPDYTMACPEEMQDDFSMISRRDEMDAEWDVLSERAGEFIRLCLLSNGL